MDRKHLLIERFDQIGRSLEKSGAALALIGLGSVGAGLDRLDAYSDLDFFVIARPGHGQGLLDDLAWLGAIQPIAFSFKNSDDGYKLMFADGIYCEFAVFKPGELKKIAYESARLAWQAEDFDPDFHFPHRPEPVAPQKDVTRLVGEALTNLYVGLGRYRRGERLSAALFIQGYTVDRILELAALTEEPQPGHRDPFAGHRRFEQRFPQTAARLPEFMQGYERTVQSAQAILTFLEEHFEVDAFLKQAIEAFWSEDCS